MRLITDEDGDVVFSASYDAWGNTLSLTDSVPDGGWMYRYVGVYGCRFDIDTGLTYMRQRWYSAHAQRFLSRDVRWAANRYIYASNNSPSRIDPMGTDPLGDAQQATETVGSAADAPQSQAIADIQSYLQQALQNNAQALQTNNPATPQNPQAISLMAPEDPNDTLLVNNFAASHFPPDALTVMIHGNVGMNSTNFFYVPGGNPRMGVNGFVSWINDMSSPNVSVGLLLLDLPPIDPSQQPIFMFSCNSGRRLRDGHIVAQDISNGTGRIVVSPNDGIRFWAPDSINFEGKTSSPSYNVFYPGGTSGVPLVPP